MSSTQFAKDLRVNEPSHAEATLSRLLTVDWDGDFDVSYRHAASRAKLMQEYLRRSARWAAQLNATQEWPFFDIAGRLAPEIEPPAKLAEQLEESIVNRTGWPSDRTIARAAFHWAALVDVIDLGASSILRKTWQDHLSTEPIVALDSATLDALDEAAN